MGYLYYFEFTITPYGAEIEPNLPAKTEIIETFKKLSDKISPKRVDWRFDPIIIDEHYSKAWVEDQFGLFCRKLCDFTEKCIISFVDDYSRTRDRMVLFGENNMIEIAESIVEIANEYHLPVYSCSEEVDLSNYGILHSSCIDQNKIEQIIGYPISVKKDKGQRPACQCIESIDVGAYDTCGNGCSYCYATKNEKMAERRRKNHNPGLPMLTGLPKGNETITDRTLPSQRIDQLTFLD